MASKTVQPIAIELGIKGGERLAALNRSFRDLSKQTKLSDKDIVQATKDIAKFAKEVGNSEATIKGQIKAFEGLREQAAMGGKVYRELGASIIDLGLTLKGSSRQIEEQRSALLEIGSAASSSSAQIKKAIDGLKQLRNQASQDSQAFFGLSKEIDELTKKVNSLDAALEQNASRNRARAASVTGVLAKYEAAAGKQAQAAKEREEIVRGEVLALSEKGRATSELTKKENQLTAAIARRRQLGVQETAREARRSVRAGAQIYTGNTELGPIDALDQRLGDLPATTAAFSQKLTELQDRLINTVRSSDQYVAVALRIAQVQREATATAQWLGAALVKDLASGNTVRNQKNLREAIGQLQAEMNELNTETAEGSSKYAENARQVNNLQKQLDEIAGSYRNVTDMARQASTAQGVYANTSVGSNYLRRGIVRRQEAARAELGAAVRAGVASTPLLLPAAGQTSAPGTGLERSGRAEPLIPESRRGFAQESLGGARLQGPELYRPGPALPPDFAAGMSEPIKKQANALREAATAYKPYNAEIRKAKAANNGSISGINNLRAALERKRNELPTTTSAFKRLTQQIESLDRQAEKASKRMSRRKFSPGKAAQVAGATISGGIFGGPEGFLGGAIGGAVGGVGGSFAGAALGAQVGQLRQQLGGFAEYAAGITKLKIALKGITDDAYSYEQALQAAADVTKELNVPQETAIKGITRLTAAVKGAGGGVVDAELAFKNITAAITATGGGAEQVEGAVTALVQIFSKGKVSAEEINQIAERLPGTFNKIAEASGRTGPELTKALQAGEVGLNDLMKFLVQLGGEYGELAEKIAGSSESAGARLTVAYNNMRIEVGKALQPIGAEFQQAFADFIENITPALLSTLPGLGQLFLSVAKNLDVLAAAAVAAGLALGGLAAKVAIIKAGSIAALFAKIATAASSAGIALKGMSAAALLNPWVLLAAGAAAATVGIVKYYQGQKELNQLLDEGKGSTETIKEKMQEYRDEITKTRAKLKGINGEQKATGRQANSLKKKVAELRSELERLDGTYRIRIKYENQGYKYDEKGRMEEFTVGGIVYGGPRGARAKPLRRVDGTPLDGGLTVYDDPSGTGTGTGTDGGGGKGSADQTLSRLISLQNKYDSILRSSPLLEIQRFQLVNSLALVRAQEDNNAELVNTIKNNEINLDFADQELRIRNQYIDARNAAKSIENPQERLLEERIAERKQDFELEKLLISANGRKLDLTQETAIAAERIAKASEDELFNLRDQLGLVGKQERIDRFRQSRIDARDPNAEQQADLFRQTIDPTLIEGLSQNIRSLKKDLEDLINPINQITGAANAIGSAFSQSFTDAISGSKSAKEALADFFKSVGSYFLDMAGQIIAKMVTIAILNAVTGLLPGGGGSLGFNPNAPSITGNSLGDFGGGSFGGFMANGGPVSANTPYIVGERGPELFVPFQQGNITSNEDLEAQMRDTRSADMAFSGGNRFQRGGDSSVSNSFQQLQSVNLPFTRNAEQSSMVAAERETAQAISNPAPLNVRFESQVINGVEYVTAEQHRQGMAQAAERGRSLTLSALQGSVKTRKKVGLS